MSEDSNPFIGEADPAEDAELGAALGGAGGAMAGALAGSVMGPAGTVVGSLVGGLVGAVSSGAAVAAVDRIDNDDNLSGVGSGILSDEDDEDPKTIVWPPHMDASGNPIP